MSASVPPTAETPLAALYDPVYRGTPSWDIGRPQRAFVYLAEAGAIGERVLDVGCGTGELALSFARRGHRVLGIDFAPRAIEQARAEARWRRIPAHVLVWDALRLPDLAARGLEFDTVTDSAMSHTLGGRTATASSTASKRSSDRVGACWSSVTPAPTATTRRAGSPAESSASDFDPRTAGR